MDATTSLERARLDAPASVRKGLAWWLAPDMALVIAIVTLLYILVLFDGTQGLLGDSDTGWHIRTGEAILNGEGLPHTDPYSLLRFGEPWFAWEWGADVVMGFAHQHGGLAGLTGLFAVVLASCAWLWFRLNAVLGGHFLIAAVLTPVMLMITQIHWHARPHVLSWIFFLCAMHYAERPRRSLWVVALASVLWANLHASFFFGAVIFLIYAAGHLMRPLIWDGTDRPAEWREARWFFLAACISLISTLVNPYGWEVHLHVFNYLRNSELLARIGEFHSYNFFAEGSERILLGLVVAGVGGVLAFSQRKLEHAMLVMLLVVVGLRSARGLPMVALLCLPIANAAITLALRRAPGLHDELRRRIDGFLQYGANLWSLDSRFAGPGLALVAIAILIFALQLPAVAQRAGFPEKDFPVKAAQQLDQLPRNIRLLAPDVYGGYLIYRFNGDLKVFFDGRSDFYGALYMKDYLDLMDVREGWRERVATMGFTHALLPKRYSLVPALEMTGWKRLYADDVAVLLAMPAAAAITEKQ